MNPSGFSAISPSWLRSDVLLFPSFVDMLLGNLDELFEGCREDLRLTGMKDQDFETLIQEVRRQSLPVCPGSVESNVLQRIRLAKHDDESSLWAWVASLLLHPGFVAAALTLVVFLSSGLAVATVKSFVKDEQSRQIVSEQLDFGIFNQTDYIGFADHRS